MVFSSWWTTNTQILCILAGAADSMPVSQFCDSPPTCFSTAIYFRAENRLNSHFQWNYSQRHGNISIAKLLSENIMQSLFLFIHYFCRSASGEILTQYCKIQGGDFWKLFSSQVFCLYKMYVFPMSLPNNANSQIELSSSGEKEGRRIFGGNYRDHANSFWKAKVPS